MLTGRIRLFWTLALLVLLALAGSSMQQEENEPRDFAPLPPPP